MASNNLPIRHEIFEYYTFPTPAKMTMTNLVNLVTALFQNGIGSDHKISLDLFISLTCKNIPGITPKEAECYFLLSRIIEEDDMNLLHSVLQQQPAGGKTGILKSTVLANDARSLATYMFLQLLSTFSRHSVAVESKQKEFNYNESFTKKSSLNVSGGHGFSPINSPRAKATRPIVNSNEHQQVLAFLRYNLKYMLKLVSNNIEKSDDALISLPEFQSLARLLFRSQDLPGKPPSVKKLPQTPLQEVQAIFATNPRQPINNILELLTANLSIQDTEGVFTIQGLTRSVCLKDRESFQSAREIRIIGCEDSYIYIDATVPYLSIINCVNTTIFISAVQKVTLVDKCENISLTLASNFLRVCNSIDTTISYYGAYPPILYGDNKALLLGPHNANATDLFARLKEGKLPVLPIFMTNYANPLSILNNGVANNLLYNIQQPKDFSMLVLPPSYKVIPNRFLLTTDIMLAYLQDPRGEMHDPKHLTEESQAIRLPTLAPDEFRETIIARHKKFAELQTTLKSLKISEAEQANVHMIVQGFFREWLTNTGHSKPLLDLVKLIEQD